MASKRGKRDPTAGMPPDMRNAFQKVMSTFNTKEYNGDISNLMHHLSMQDPADVEALFSAATGSKPSEDQLSDFDYKSVPVRRDSFWVMQLTPMGFQGEDTKDYRDEYFPGSKPVFSVIIYDDRTSYLAQEMAPPGMPSSDFLINVLKKAIAAPLPPNSPCAPNLLLIAQKLSAHVGALRPFLDSLPAPFGWRLETAEEIEQVASGVHDLNVKGVAKATRRAEEEKRLGNEAVGRKDRTAAVKHYSEAFEFYADAFSQKPTATADEEHGIKRSMAICLANRAAAWLMEGEGRDAKKALADAERAAAFDEDYGKAYYRQAKAHQLLDAREKSIDVLTSALKRPSLASDKGLVDTLVDAYGGFPDSADELRTLCHRLFIDDDGDLRARDIREFVRRADVHVKKILGPEFSVTAV
ncbi:uncharacterized protein C8Q71DRAFT_780277 [Rhodofomes roseus]|uniref:Uncharacterized protein n=1 Tax=Rhodofomes roseus TaxID=34475 RepID=A0ABQ8K4G0_9APHY|nr:uncharacterized protein C8Q71DRAFT_780277 [Rhodofomes roseus]KAH9831777.1 hypothetical protein C8Q71DRAFT_780277 [Rhodofomes roseus]